MPAPAIEAVCFDLDGTLCVRDQTLEAIHEAVFERVDVEPFYTPADIRAVDVADLPPAESAREFYEHSIRAIAENVGGDPGHAPALAEATVAVVDETAVSFREGAREALAAARERYAVGLVTNGGEETQRAKLERLGIDDAFDATVFCHPETGIDPKPDPEPFERALAGLDATPETTVTVGDSHGMDVVGAHRAGLRSVWVPREGHDPATGQRPEPEPTHRLDSMAEVPEVVCDDSAVTPADDGHSKSRLNGR